MKKTIRVFPDYGSSGLWEPRRPEGTGANMDESEVVSLCSSTSNDCFEVLAQGLGGSC